MYRVRFEGEDDQDSNDRWFAGRNYNEGLPLVFQHLVWARAILIKIIAFDKAKKAWPDKKFELVS